jgi:DNA-binding CsgD family transcriptional regulator
LARGDEGRILRFVAEAESFGGEHPFEGEFLSQLGRLVPADWVCYCDFVESHGDGSGNNFERPGDEGIASDIDWEEVGPIVMSAENPLVRHFQQGSSDAVRLSDCLTRRELHYTQIYDLLMKPCGLEHSLGIRLPIAPPERARFAMDRGGQDFSARDCAVLEALSPHLVRLHRAHAVRRRLDAALAVHESSGVAVMLLEDDGRVAFASSAARALVERYFGMNGAVLPEPLTSWLAERRRGAAEPLEVESGGRTLVVELGDDALLLEERRPLPRLTPREHELLELVAEGRTNAEIAKRLWISVGTVRKHLDNVYAKLGVHTRTAAAAVLRDG